MTKFVCELTVEVEGIEIIKESIIDGKRVIEEMIVDGILCVRTGENKYELRMDGWTWHVDARGKVDNLVELANLLKEEVECFNDVCGGYTKVPDENMHKYLTLGDLREMLKDLPDDTLILGLEDGFMEVVAVGYVVQRIETRHDLAGGFDYKARHVRLKNATQVGGLVNSESYNHPENEDCYAKQVAENKAAIKDFAKTYNKDERVGVKLW